MRGLYSVFFCLWGVLGTSCHMSENTPKILVEAVYTNQFPENDDLGNFQVLEDNDFEGVICYDLNIINESDSILSFSYVPDKINMYGIFKEDTLLLNYLPAYRKILLVEPESYEIGMAELVLGDIYEKKYKKTYPTFRKFSEYLVAHTILIFKSDQNDVFVVKNNKKLEFRGNPNDMGLFQFVPLKKGKLPQK